MKTTEQHLEEMTIAMKGMLKMIEGWSDEDLKYKPNKGSWNVLQILDHIILSEKGTLGYMMKKSRSGWQELPKSAHEHEHSSLKLDHALSSSERWQAPSVLPDPSDDRPIENVVSYWYGFRQKLDAFVEQLDPEFYERQIFRHPYAGRLNLFQTLSFLTKHIDHHTFQIERLSKSMKEKTT
jgi:uncharacterized damage-inducible protein DinB